MTIFEFPFFGIKETSEKLLYALLIEISGLSQKALRNNLTNSYAFNNIAPLTTKGL